MLASLSKAAPPRGIGGRPTEETLKPSSASALRTLAVKGVAGCLIEAQKWYRKAADQGHAEAQFNLAFSYLGSDEPEDHRRAARLCVKAADQGHAEAQFWLGHLL